MTKKAFSLIELSIVILIIGIVIAGVTQSSRLVAQHKLQTARTLTQSSPVNSITGLVTWIESTSEKSFDAAEQEDGLSITNWYDLNIQSSSKNNFTQSTNKPTYKTNFFNGLPVISFDGTNDFMATQSITSTEFSPANTNTIFLVAKIYSGGVIFKFEQSAANRLGIEMAGSGMRFDFPNDTTGMLSDTTSIINRPYIFTFDHNSSTQTIYTNGASYDTQANALTFTGTFSSTMAIGATVGGTQYFTRMDLAELIIFNRSLKSEERKSIEKYLGQKWGIKVS